MENQVGLWTLYLVAVNLAAVIVCVYDKLMAIKGGWRVRERTLFFLALIGGSPLLYMTMLIIRHKTLHKRFMIGLPLIMAAQAAVILLVVYFF